MGGLSSSCRVRRRGEKVGERVGGGELEEERACLRKTSARACARPRARVVRRADLLVEDALEQLGGDGHAGVVEARAVVNPLPDLRARDFRGRGVFHEMVERDAADAAQPRFDVLHADAHVLSQSFFGARARRDTQ